MKFKNSGFSLITFLIALSISSLLLNISAQGITQIIKNTKSYKNYTDEALRIDHIKGVLSLLMREVDYHRLSLGPTVYHQDILWSDGTSTQLPKKYGTDAIAQTTLDSSSTLVRKEFNNDTLFFCPKFQSQKQTYDFFIGVSPDGLGEFKSDIALSNQVCQNITLFPVRGINPGMKEYEPKRVKILIPIKREYALFISPQDEFRYVGIKKGIIVEHQPIERGIKDLQLSISSLQALPISILDATIIASTITKRVPFSHALGRVPFTSYLYNIS